MAAATTRVSTDRSARERCTPPSWSRRHRPARRPWIRAAERHTPDRCPLRAQMASRARGRPHREPFLRRRTLGLRLVTPSHNAYRTALRPRSSDHASSTMVLRSHQTCLCPLTPARRSNQTVRRSNRTVRQSRTCDRFAMRSVRSSNTKALRQDQTGRSHRGPSRRGNQTGRSSITKVRRSRTKVRSPRTSCLWAMPRCCYEGAHDPRLRHGPRLPLRGPRSARAPSHPVAPAPAFRTELPRRGGPRPRDRADVPAPAGRRSVPCGAPRRVVLRVPAR